MTATHDRAREILRRSLTLEEIVDLASDESGTPAPENALDSWVRAFSPSDPAALTRRLAWDSISVGRAAAAFSGRLSREPEDTGLTDWLSAIEGSCVARTRNPVPVESLADIPFSPIWIPILDVAARTLRRRVPNIDDTLSPEARSDLVRHLGQQVAWWGNSAAWERFERARKDGTSFDGFCNQVLTDPIEFFLEYSALARRLMSLSDQWVHTTAELLERLTSDRNDIRRHFGLDVERVARISSGLSDRHDGGRQVATLQLDSGERIVYKPRQCRSLRRFNELLFWYRERGGGESPHPTEVDDRGGYAWVEHVTHDELQPTEDAGIYFRKAGALACLAWLLGGRDLHMDNIICTNDGPVIVDTEVFVQPDWTESASETAGAMQRARDHVSSSIIGTGMISFPQQNDEGQVYDIGGLCGEGGYRSPSPRIVYRETNTDSMRREEETFIVNSMENVVRINGRIERPEAWVDQIVEGFETAFETVLEHRDELLDREGPIASFGDARARMLFRPSNQYALVLQLLTSPACSRLGVTGSLYIESQARVFNHEKDRPVLWPLFRSEKASLERLDIPLFTIGSDSLVLDTPNGSIEGLADRTGLAALLKRIERLDHTRLVEQTRLIRAMLLSSSRHVEDDGEESVILAAPASDPSVFVDEARSLGEVLLSTAVRGDDGSVTWIAPEYVKIENLADLGVTYYLYSGVTGPSIFLAALARATGEKRYAAASRAIWIPLEQMIESGDAESVRDQFRLGICNGIGSIVYAALVAADLLGDESIVGLARGFADLIDRGRIDREKDLDIEGGVAGAAVALVRLYQVTGQKSYLDLARHAGERLTSAASTNESGTFWPHDPQAPPLAGMAHGAAGIAFALNCLTEATKDDVFATTAREAFRWEETVFDSSTGNWPVRTPDGRSIDMVAWCHGAPGIGLTRIACTSNLATTVGRDLELATERVVASGLNATDHVCCGNSGRIDFLLEAAQALGDEALLDDARRRATAMVERAHATSSYTLTTEQSDRDLTRPGFFRGLAGIGYTLLRTADSQSLPAITRFELPEREERCAE